MASMRLSLWLRYLVGSRLAPFVPTPHHVGRCMLDLAAVKPSDTVYDLGCGDARLLIAAAKTYGAKGYGVELDSKLFGEAQEAIQKENLSHMVRVEQKDAMKVDLRDATVVTLYLSEKGNLRLLPKMKMELPASARVVSFCWCIPGVNASRTTRVDGINVFLYDTVSLNAPSSSSSSSYS